MGIKRKASTIYLQPEIHKALKLKAVIRDCSLSDLAEEMEDIKTVQKRKKESSVNFDHFVKMLKDDNKI